MANDNNINNLCLLCYWNYDLFTAKYAVTQ